MNYKGIFICRYPMPVLLVVLFFLACAIIPNRWEGKGKYSVDRQTPDDDSDQDSAHWHIADLTPEVSTSVDRDPGAFLRHQREAEDSSLFVAMEPDSEILNWDYEADTEALQINKTKLNHPQIHLEVEVYVGRGRDILVPNYAPFAKSPLKIEKEYYVWEKRRSFVRYYVASWLVKRQYGRDGFIIWFTGPFVTLEQNGKEFSLWRSSPCCIYYRGQEVDLPYDYDWDFQDLEEADGKLWKIDSLTTIFNQLDWMLELDSLSRIKKKQVRRILNLNIKKREHEFCRIIPRVRVPGSDPTTYGYCQFVPFEEINPFEEFLIRFLVIEDDPHFKTRGDAVITVRVDPDYGLIEVRKR